MVTIFTNENNPATLKLIIAKDYANVDVKIEIVNIADRSIQEPRHLPYLKIKSNRSIFIPNAAIWYLFPASNETPDKVHEWLEWESNVLAPNLAQTFGSSIKNDSIRNALIVNLKTLNCSLDTRACLIDEKISPCDIAIWSSLYPLYKDDKLSKEYLTELPNVISWVKKLENNPHFKNATSIFKIDGGNAAYQALLNGAKYLTPIANGQQTNQSPQHQSEVISNEELEAAEKAWQKNSSQLPKFKTPEKVVLPVPGEKNIFITSALPYVNNVPHLGNIIGCVLSADVFARFCRLCNHNTLFVCGTDEYGTATETKALEEGLSCKQICDKYYKIHDEIYKWFNISFDRFGRTSSPEQKEMCQDLFFKLNDNGFMFTQAVEQLHCENCNRYLADRFVEGGCPHVDCNYEDARGDQCDGCGKLVNAVELKNPRCKICNSSPKLKTSTQFFIDLPKLEPLLHHWMKKSAPGWSYNAQVIGKAWLKEGLKPRCITRDLKWGVPVPLDGFRNKVFYVWFDAPIGYMSITKSYMKDYEIWWRPANGTDVTLYQFMAKDNVPFHAVLFPGMLLGANKGYLTVSHIMATEYLNYEDGKFSKSRGVGVFGTDARDTGIPSDVWRFYLLYVRPESQDSSFSWSDLVTKNNSELLNNLGNFINRALVFAKNNFNKTVPKMNTIKDDYKLLALCTREYKNYIASLEKAKLRDGIRHILAISRHGNQYMQANQPWVLLKGTDEEKSRAGTVIGICCNLACLLATLLHPYMPDTSANLKKQLNVSETVIILNNAEIVTVLPPGHKLGEPSPLFTKIEMARVEELKLKYAGKQNDDSTKLNVDLRVIEAEIAKQADKVRALKVSGVDKKLWQPELTILLNLKKKLEVGQKNSSSDKKPSEQFQTQNGIVNPVDIRLLEAKIVEQGWVVRKLKESGAEKSVWQLEVEKLLTLKNQLAGASGAPLLKNGKEGKK